MEFNHKNPILNKLNEFHIKQKLNSILRKKTQFHVTKKNLKTSLYVLYTPNLIEMQVFSTILVYLPFYLSQILFKNSKFEVLVFFGVLVSLQSFCIFVYGIFLVLLINIDYL